MSMAGDFRDGERRVFDAAQLSRFNAVVCNNVSGDVLTPLQQEAFKSYIETAAASLAFMEAGATRAIGGAGTSIH